MASKSASGSLAAPERLPSYFQTIATDAATAAAASATARAAAAATTAAAASATARAAAAAAAAAAKDADFYAFIDVYRSCNQRSAL